MAKCNFCGELNPDNGLYCSKCGKPIEKESQQNQEIVDKMQHQFEKDAKVGVDRSKLTYVCELCGTINHIDAARCQRCGKPRPRSEYLAALKRLRSAETEGKEAIVAPSLIQEPDAPQEPKQEEAAQATPFGAPVYRLEQTASPQPQSFVQPFVVVPYVDNQHPLWQYNPRQLYRLNEQYAPPIEEQVFVANYFDERREQAEELVGEAPFAQQEPTKKERKNSKKKIKLAANICTAALAILMVIAYFVFDMVVLDGNRFYGFAVLESVALPFASLQLALDPASHSAINFDHPAFVMLPMSYIFGILLAVVVFVLALVRAVKGQSASVGAIVFSVLTLCAAGVALFGFALVTNYSDFNTFLRRLDYGMFVLLAAAVLQLVCTVVAFQKKEKIATN